MSLPAASEPETKRATVRVHLPAGPAEMPVHARLGLMSQA